VGFLLIKVAENITIFSVTGTSCHLLVQRNFQVNRYIFRYIKKVAILSFLIRREIKMSNVFRSLCFVGYTTIALTGCETGPDCRKSPFSKTQTTTGLKWYENEEQKLEDKLLPYKNQVTMLFDGERSSPGKCTGILRSTTVENVSEKFFLMSCNSSVQDESEKKIAQVIESNVSASLSTSITAFS
jgi:hypothetical protein